MKCEELMIGDWVTVSGKPMQVASIRTTRVGFKDEDGYIFYHLYEEVNPIQLTKEILVNNGFERIDTTIGNYALRIYVEKAYDENDYNSTREFLRIGTYLSGGYFDGYFEIENRTKEGYTSCKRRCKYVHELQHSLRLCEINKEIKL